MLRHITAPSPAYAVHYYSAVYINLTQREKEILASFCRGMSYVAIAEAKEVKVVTIRNAIYTIQVNLGVDSKQEMVVWAAQNGLLDD